MSRNKTHRILPVLNFQWSIIITGLFRRMVSSMCPKWRKYLWRSNPHTETKSKIWRMNKSNKCSNNSNARSKSNKNKAVRIKECLTFHYSPILSPATLTKITMIQQVYTATVPDTPQGTMQNPHPISTTIPQKVIGWVWIKAKTDEIAKWDNLTHTIMGITLLLLAMWYRRGNQGIVNKLGNSTMTILINI